MKRNIIICCLTASLMLACTAERESAQSDLPRCEPRATSDPARLNIDTEAEQHGAIAPCEIALSLFIARNSALRSMQTRVSLTGPDGEAVGDELVEVSLRGPEAGLFRGEIQPAPLESHACRELTLELELQRCADEANRPIECPTVRLKESFVLAGLSARGPDLDICMEQ